MLLNCIIILVLSDVQYIVPYLRNGSVQLHCTLALTGQHTVQDRYSAFIHSQIFIYFMKIKGKYTIVNNKAYSQKSEEQRPARDRDWSLCLGNHSNLIVFITYSFHHIYHTVCIKSSFTLIGI